MARALEVINTLEKGETGAISTIWTVYKEGDKYPVCACYNSWEKLLAEDTLDVLINGEVVNINLNPVATENGKSTVDIIVRMPHSEHELFPGILSLLDELCSNDD